MAGLDASPEELAGAATKISAVYRGKKAREAIKEKKADLASSKQEAGAEESQVAETPANPEGGEAVESEKKE